MAIERLRLLERKEEKRKIGEPFMRYTIPLDTARTGERFDVSGSFLLVEKLDGSCSITLNRQDSASIDLETYREINTPFERIFITNSAQSGKSITFLVGGGRAKKKERIRRDVIDYTLFENESLNATDTITHYNVDTTDYVSIMILVSSTAQVTVYPQFSNDETNWYDYCDSAGTPISYIVDACKKAIAIDDCQARYFRIVVYANESSTISAYLTLQS